MKIKSYFPLAYAVFLSFIAITYSIMGYFFVKNGFYFMLIVLLIIAISNVSSINLYDDKIIILQLYQIIIIKFELIEKVEFGYYRESLPCLFFHMKNGKSKKVYYKFYAKETSIDIIQYALKKNMNIEIGSEVKAFIGSDS